MPAAFYFAKYLRISEICCTFAADFKNTMNMKKISVLFLIALTICACKIDEPVINSKVEAELNKPGVCFDAEPTVDDLTYKFKASSSGSVVEYMWDFGDDTHTEIIKDKVIFHIYEKYGYYVVKLTGYTKDGEEATYTRRIKVEKITYY